MKTDAEPEVDLTQLALVGELTTEDGPMLDDHFLALVYKDGGYTLIPVDTKLGPFVERLSSRLGTLIEFELLHSTTFRSRVIYPDALREQPLFTLEKKTGGLRELWQAIKRFGSTDATIVLTPEIAAWLKR